MDSLSTNVQQLTNNLQQVPDQNFPALTTAVSKIESSHSDKSSISSSSQGPSPDWSKAITWAQVASMKSPFSQQKDGDKKIGMARLTEEAAESFMDTAESSTPPMQ
ncbi:hypothetical protein KI387_021412, partial [Taxus chinensis]